MVDNVIPLAHRICGKADQDAVDEVTEYSDHQTDLLIYRAIVINSDNDFGVDDNYLMGVLEREFGE